MYVYTFASNAVHGGLTVSNPHLACTIMHIIPIHVALILSVHICLSVGGVKLLFLVTGLHACHYLVMHDVHV